MTNRYVVVSAAAASVGLGVVGMWACVETYSTDSCPNPDYNHWVNGNPDPCYFFGSGPDAGSVTAEAGGDADEASDAANARDASDK